MQIPNYRIEKKIGEGGMAIVYLAVHKMMKRQVALKVMLPALSREKGFKESFLHEGEIIAQLEHPNIVRIYDINVVDDIYYMSMEYLSGGSLKEHLVDKKYSITSCVTLLKQVGAGLTLAHKHGYIHRDIKPANILFSRHDTAILTDFGIAKLQDTCSDLTKMGYMLGTVQYMSPEQATTQPLDHRSDIYSLGLVFYELLTGKKVVDAKTTLQALYQHTNEPPPTFPPPYEHLQPVLNKVLAKKPEDRFSTVQAFLEALIAVSSRKNDLSNNLIVDEKKPTNKQPTRQQPKASKDKKPASKKQVARRSTWIKPVAVFTTLTAGLLAGAFFYVDNANEKGKTSHTIKTVHKTDKTQAIEQPRKKIGRIYEPYVYYRELEHELDLLAKETMELLELVPDNKQAQQSLEDILSRYHALALTLVKKMNSQKAMVIIDKGLALANHDQSLITLKKRINRKSDANLFSEKESKYIQTLMNKANSHSQAGRYVTPQGENALEVYQDILMVDPHNQHVIDKINAIVSIFENKAKNYLDKNPYQANEFLNQAIAIAPFNKELIQLQNKIKQLKEHETE